MKNIGDFTAITRLTELIRDDERRALVRKILIIAGIVCIGAVVAYLIYKRLAPDYMDEFDDFDEDFDDNFFDDDEDEDVVTFVEEAAEKAADAVGEAAEAAEEAVDNIFAEDRE